MSVADVGTSSRRSREGVVPVQDVVLGVLAVLVGASLCFQGYWALRVVISLWGGFVGFSLGAGAIASITGDNVLATLLGWFVALVLAMIFVVIAYLYYAIAVVLAMGSAGFALGAGAMVALDESWSWIPVIVGVVVGVAVALVAIVVDLPMILLVIIGAAGGASVIVTGIMLLTNSISTADFDSESVTSAVDHGSWWAVLVLVLFVAGVVVQARSVTWRRGLRQTWSAPAEPTQPAA
jgi:hypothetical protein